MEKIKELQELLQMENVKDAKERFKEIAKILSKSLSTIKREYKIAILKIKDYYVIKENTESEKKECSKVA